MKITFCELDPFNLPQESRAFLDASAHKIGCNLFDSDDYVEAAQNKKMTIYGVYSDNRMIGSFTLDVRAMKRARVLTLSLLGSKNLKSWRDDLVKFIVELGKVHKCTDFSMMGRLGFNRLFPELKLNACIYSVDLNKFHGKL